MRGDFGCYWIRLSIAPNARQLGKMEAADGLDLRTFLGRFVGYFFVFIMPVFILVTVIVVSCYAIFRLVPASRNQADKSVETEFTEEQIALVISQLSETDKRFIWCAGAPSDGCKYQDIVSDLGATTEREKREVHNERAELQREDIISYDNPDVRLTGLGWLLHDWLCNHGYEDDAQELGTSK